jgi:hypothetical protein
VRAEVRATGERANIVAQRLGVAASSAYLWMNAASAPSVPVFARVVPKRVATVRVQVRDAVVIVERSTGGYLTPTRYELPASPRLNVLAKAFRLAKRGAVTLP